MKDWTAEHKADGLEEYRVTLFEEPGDHHKIVFDCWATDRDHAEEQAENAYPNGTIWDVIEKHLLGESS